MKMRKAMVLLLAALMLALGSTSAAFAAESMAVDRVAQEEVQDEDDDGGDRGLWGLLGLLGLGGLAGLMRRDRERDRARGDYTDTGASTRTRNP